MPRIPYIPDSPSFSNHVPDPPPFTNPEDVALVSRIRERRIAAGHDGLVELDRLLLHAPPIASGWNSFLGAIRTQTSLPDDIREVIICRVAALNDAKYEWMHHAPILRRALLELPDLRSATVLNDIPGLTRQWSSDPADTARIEGMADSFLKEMQEQKEGTWIALACTTLGGHWMKRYRELLPYVDAMTVNVKVPEQVFVALRGSLPPGPDGDRQMVEITSTCASYNCVSRFLVALNVGDMDP